MNRWRRPFLSLARISSYGEDQIGVPATTMIYHFNGSKIITTGPFKLIDWDLMREKLFKENGGADNG